MSIRCTSTRQRSTCARNRWPRPAPRAAPSISPGMSARTSCRSSDSSVPSTGSTVVKGYSATLGLARVSRRSSDDFPALGCPTKPASARSFSRNSIHPDSPSSPLSANRGPWRVELAKRLFPRPPPPPRPTIGPCPDRAELRRSDGTAAGTRLVRDIAPGTESSPPFYLTRVGDFFLFQAYDPDHGFELWRSDGTAAGTELVKDIDPGRTGSHRVGQD